MSYIDTQGISLPSDGPIDRNIQYKPMPVKKLNVFTDKEREELKSIFKEALTEYYPKYEDESWLYRGTY